MLPARTEKSSQGIDQGHASVNNAILENARRFAFELFNKSLRSCRVYHNYQHTVDLVATCGEIAAGNNEISSEDLEILLIAAWLHDTGYAGTTDNPEEKSKEIAGEFLAGQNYDKDKTKAVLECIGSTIKNREPASLTGRILADANIADIGLEIFPAKATLLRAEWERSGKAAGSEEEYIMEILDFFNAGKFHTEAAQRMFGARAEANVETLIRKAEKVEKKGKKKKGKDKDSRRGTQTMFRCIYRNHINLSSIADDKANMLIRVNSFIISIALTLVGAKFSFLGASFRQNQIVIYPIITLLLTSLVTIIFAILSAKPKVTHKVHTVKDIHNKNASLLFFGNFTTIELDEYKGGMRELIKNRNDIYDSMMTDLYYLGKVLNRKYYLINISYMVFMIGLILTAAATLLVVIHLKRAGSYI